MEVEKIAGVDLLDFGSKYTLAGALYVGDDSALGFLFPDVAFAEIETTVLSKLSPIEWNALIRQSDEMNVRGLGGIILKKGTRIVDQSVAWRVYRRDGFRCRYCAAENRPLTVDHVDLWENGGATVEENLVAACRPCNRTRGETPYGVWLDSVEYLKRAVDLTAETRRENEMLVSRLPKLAAMRVSGKRSR